MRKFLISMGATLLLAVLGFAVILPLLSQAKQARFEAERRAEQTLPAYWRAPDFALTDQAGNTVTNADLKGEVWAADFFFTRCPGICPMLSANMRAMNADLADHPQRDQLRLVSFSLDPEHDTPEVLGAYAEAINATPADWLFLNGSRDAIWQVSEQGFKLAVSDTPDDPANPISHTGKVVLVDRVGMIRGFYEGLTPQGMADLQRDLRRLLDEE